jgi:glycosyltransferase involved in cell wall biosynthesis
MDRAIEYYPHYLQHVMRLRNEADVLVFGYDCAATVGTKVSGPQRSFDPRTARSDLFLPGRSILAPFSIAMRREIALGVGGFSEAIWFDVEGEFLRRAARSGATFLFSGSGCGRREMGGTCERLVPTIPPQQRTRAELNFEAGDPLYGRAPANHFRGRSVHKVLFASVHSIVDPSSGAATACLDQLATLARMGFQCEAFCTSMLDTHEEVRFEELVGRFGDPYRVVPSVCGEHRASLLYTRRKHIPVTVVRLETTRPVSPAPDELRSVLTFFHKFVETFQPDVIITIDCDPISRGMIGLARRRDVPVVFAVHNFSHRNVGPFWSVDYCTSPSEFARRHYWVKLGLACHTLPNPVDWGRVLAERRDRQFLTFVNPSREKGVYGFARIAAELGRRRPDIPILVVESRGTRGTLAACGLHLGRHANIQFMANTTDPRRFWGVTKVALMPSLWWENQPLVAIEAMINGIPVIGSDRGGIPETLGESGFLLSLPERLTPSSEIVPDAAEVEPWLEVVIRLWDDRGLYAEQHSKALHEAQRWHPDRLGPVHADFFRNVRPQPGPPFLPKEGQEIELWR